jgi:alpha-D-ribose 1-methylphosphonate 5-phosphate C-P lyase
MDKIWIVISNNSYRNQKYKVYKSESQLMKAISPTDTNKEILEFDLVSKVKTTDFFTQKERDTQLRTILGDLDVREESAMSLIKMYEDIAPIGRIHTGWRYQKETNEKEIMINNLKKYQIDKKSFSALLVKNKKHFFTISTDVEWYKLILKCHNFTDNNFSKSRYDSTLRKYVKIDERTDEMKINFIEAKKQLRKKK